MKNGYRYTELYKSILVCKSKKSFATRDAAKKAQKKNRKDRGISLRPYYCEYCHSWHLKTHRPKEGKARERSEKAAIQAVVGTGVFARNR